MPTTKIYRNTGKTDLNVIGVGVVPAGNQVSITAEFQPPVVLANYPGLVDLADEPETKSGDQNEQG